MAFLAPSPYQSLDKNCVNGFACLSGKCLIGAANSLDNYGGSRSGWMRFSAVTAVIFPQDPGRHGYGSDLPPKRSTSLPGSRAVTLPKAFTTKTTLPQYISEKSVGASIFSSGVVGNGIPLQPVASRRYPHTIKPLVISFKYGTIRMSIGNLLYAVSQPMVS